MTFEQTLGLKGPKVNVNILHVKKGLSLKNASQIKFTLTAVKLYLKKTFESFFVDEVNCLKATERAQGDSLLFITKSQENPGTQLIDHIRIKG